MKLRSTAWLVLTGLAMTIPSVMMLPSGSPETSDDRKTAMVTNTSVPS